FGTTDISVYDASTLQLKRRLDVNALSTFFAGMAGDGLGGQDFSYYQFNANPGDSLTVDVTAFNAAEAGNSGEFQNGLQPGLGLFDAAGNLVATASDDGSGHAQILYTVPDGAGGAYFVQVLGENDSIGEYVLDVSGATGAANPFTVTATDPTANSHHTSFSSMTV